MFGNGLFGNYIMGSGENPRQRNTNNIKAVFTYLPGKLKILYDQFAKNKKQNMTYSTGKTYGGVVFPSRTGKISFNENCIKTSITGRNNSAVFTYQPGREIIKAQKNVKVNTTILNCSSGKTSASIKKYNYNTRLIYKAGVQEGFTPLFRFYWN